MWGLVIRRAIAAVGVLLASTAFAFVLVESATDPVASFVDRQPPPTPDAVEQLRERLYLDRPAPERYWLWLTGLGDTNGDIGLLQGHWGPSIQRLDIGEAVWERSLVTFRLIAAAVVVALVVGVASGVAGALSPGTWIDRSLTFVGLLTLAMPTFWLAALVKGTGVWIGERLGRPVVFTVFENSPDYDRLSFLGKLADSAGHLVLPTLVLVLAGHAAISRYQRAEMIEALGRDHVTLARAKGLAERTVTLRHALRTALNPVVTSVALIVSTAITGTVVVEVVFSWRGLGRFLVDSVGASDTFAVLGVVVITGTVVVAANLVADALHMALDPRTRHE